MTIYRDGKEIKLTKEEMQQVYEKVRNEQFGRDVCQKLQEHGVNPNRGDVDWKQIALEAQWWLGENDLCNDLYWDAIEMAIKYYIKERGIK